MRVLIYIFRYYLVFTLVACGNNDGLFGHSKTREEARANGSTVFEYEPDKKHFLLLDATVMEIGTAWTEMSFTYKNGKREIDTAYGYHFSVPSTNDNLKNFTFTFDLLDKANRVFTNAGPGEDGLTQLCPAHLYDTMRVLLEQKNPDTLLGWSKPIITDTIVFTRIK